MAKPIAIKEIVNEVMHGLAPDKGANNQEILAALNSFLDKKTLQHIKAERYKNNKLIIKVDSSAWLYKLNLEKNKFLDKINKALPKPEVQDVLFKIGSV